MATPLQDHMKRQAYLPQAGGGDHRSPCSCGTCRSPGRPSSESRRRARSPPGTCCRWWQRRAPLGCANGTAPSCCCAWHGACCRTGSGCPGRGTEIAATKHSIISSYSSRWKVALAQGNSLSFIAQLCSSLSLIQSQHRRCTEVLRCDLSDLGHALCSSDVKIGE